MYAISSLQCFFYNSPAPHARLNCAQKLDSSLSLFPCAGKCMQHNVEDMRLSKQNQKHMMGHFTCTTTQPASILHAAEWHTHVCIGLQPQHVHPHAPCPSQPSWVHAPSMTLKRPSLHATQACCNVRDLYACTMPASCSDTCMLYGGTKKKNLMLHTACTYWTTPLVSSNILYEHECECVWTCLAMVSSTRIMLQHVCTCRQHNTSKKVQGCRMWPYILFRVQPL